MLSSGRACGEPCCGKFAQPRNRAQNHFSKPQYKVLNKSTAPKFRAHVKHSKRENFMTAVCHLYRPSWQRVSASASTTFLINLSVFFQS